MTEKPQPNIGDWIRQSFIDNKGREPTPIEFEKAILSFADFVANKEAEELGNKKNIKPKLHRHGSRTHEEIAEIIFRKK